METFIIEGGHTLSGTITPQGAKNEALEVIAATLLTDQPVHITNIPDILDVNNLIKLLEEIGVKVTRNSRTTIHSRPMTSTSNISTATSMCRSVPLSEAACCSWDHSWDDSDTPLWQNRAATR